MTDPSPHPTPDGPPRILVIAPEPPWPAVNGCRTKLSGFVERVGRPVDLISPTVPGGPTAPAGVNWITVTSGAGRVSQLATIATGQLPISKRLPVAMVVGEVDRLLQAGARYDFVHLDTMATAHLVRPLRDLMRGRGVPSTIVLSLNDSYSLLLSSGGLNDRLKPRLYCRYVKLLERRLLPQADYVDVVSEHDVAWLERLTPRSRCRLVPLGVDVDAYRGPRLEPLWDVLYMGTMCDEAFHWLRQALDAALPVLRAGSPGLRVAAAGPDATPQALRYFEEHAVTHLGFVDDLSSLLRSSRMLLVSSRQRAGTPTKALQAMAAGTPVVGMEALRGIPNGQDHVTYSAASGWDDLAGRMDRLLSEVGYAARVGEGGRQLVERQHDWPVVVERYLRVPDDHGAAPRC